MTAIERMFILLENQGKSIQSLCNYLNISSSVMANWKKRSEYPPAKYLLTICEFLGISTDYLLSGKDADKKLTLNEQKMLKLLHNLETETEQLNLISYIEGYVDRLLCEKRSNEGADAQQRTGKVG